VFSAGSPIEAVNTTSQVIDDTAGKTRLTLLREGKTAGAFTTQQVADFPRRRVAHHCRHTINFEQV
jgi:hypothetical protein